MFPHNAVLLHSWANFSVNITDFHLHRGLLWIFYIVASLYTPLNDDKLYRHKKDFSSRSWSTWWKRSCGQEPLTFQFHCLFFFFLLICFCCEVLWLKNSPWNPRNRTPKLFSFSRTQKQQNSPSWGKKQLCVEKAVVPSCLYWTTELLIMSMCWHKSWILLVTFFRVPAFLSEFSILYFSVYSFSGLLILLSYLCPLIATIFRLSPNSMFPFVHLSWLSLVSSMFDPTLKTLLFFQLFLSKIASLYPSCLSVHHSW